MQKKLRIKKKIQLKKKKTVNKNNVGERNKVKKRCSKKNVGGAISKRANHFKSKKEINIWMKERKFGING